MHSKIGAVLYEPFHSSSKRDFQRNCKTALNYLATMFNCIAVQSREVFYDFASFIIHFDSIFPSHPSLLMVDYHFFVVVVPYQTIIKGVFFRCIENLHSFSRSPDPCPTAYGTRQWTASFKRAVTR